MKHPPDDIERLIQLAGKQQPIATQRGQRVRAEVFATWQSSVRVRRRRKVLSYGGLLATAVLLAAFIGFWRTSQSNPANGGHAQTMMVHRVLGQVTIQPFGADSASDFAVAQTLSQGMIVEPGVEFASDRHGQAGFSAGSDYNLRMADGTRLRFLGENHWFLATGRIYVATHIQSGLAKLTIETPHGHLVNLGTRFEVQVEDRNTQVSVRQGEVILRWSSQRERIRSGEAIQLAPNGVAQRTTIPLHGDVWNWTLPLGPDFGLEGQTLGTFLTWVETETGRSYQFAEPALEAELLDTILHGELGQLGPYEALATVLPTCQLDYVLAEEKILISEAELGSPSPDL